MTAKISLLLVAGLTLCGGAGATTPGNPYQSIVTRNVFDLKDPPPSCVVVQPKPAPKLTLTGILTLGRKRALMKALPAQPKPGEQPKREQYYMLGEGEQDGEVQVVSIDARLGKVTLKHGGEFVTIGFDQNPGFASGKP